MFVDDLDGSTGKDVRPVSFGLDGVVFVIHLSAANAARLRAALDRFVRAGRRLAGQSAAPVRSMDAEVTRAVRRWARENGYRVSAHGRIAARVLDAFERAHPARVDRTSAN